MAIGKVGALARYGIIRTAGALGARPATQGRPIFVVSMPRSGSSWVGAVLGGATGSLYFREPFTRTHVSSVGGATMFAVDPVAPPPTYRVVATRLLQGSPAFRPSVIGHADQWPPFSRRPRRVVVKEVNPLACRWFIDTFDPILVLLIRHPAAVALSYRKLWWREDGASDETRWRGFGARIADAWSAMFAQTEGHNDRLVMRYEDLCSDPVECFGAVADFCGLPRDGQLAVRVARHRGEGDGASDDPYALARDAALMRDSWRNRIAAGELAALMEGFGETSLPKAARYGT